MRAQVFLAVAVLMFVGAAAGGASAAASQVWWLHGNTPMVANHDDPAAPSADVVVGISVENNNLQTWPADAAAIVNVDQSGPWGYSLQLSNIGSQAGAFTVHVGKITSTGFTSFGTSARNANTEGGTGTTKVLTGTVNAAAGSVVNAGETLAFRIVNDDCSCNGGGKNFKVDQNDADTKFTSPSTDPGYPTPELGTIALVAAGLVAIGGFVYYQRRK